MQAMKVLLVEDDAGIGRIVTAGLQENGYEVDWLRLGRPVLDRLRQDHYVAVILDLMLPDIDGLVVCRSLRQAGHAVPVCMLTARDDVEDKLDGFDAGAHDYLTKPFEMRELLARLGVMVKRSRSADETRVVVGALEIDLLSRDVSLAGTPIELSPREFDVLHFLARHAGQAVTRERILQNAWSGGGEVTPNAVDVYIGYLRRKLAAAAQHPVISTVRGVGFKLS